MPSMRRVVVGASGSPGSLRALRYALARAHDATLIPVLAWVPPSGDLASYPGCRQQTVRKAAAVCARLRGRTTSVQLLARLGPGPS